jgi:nucleoside-diphosphate-sugar epimerase
MSHRPLVPVEAVRPWLERLSEPIAITGGTGFIGSHIVDTLCAAGIAPRVLIRDPARAAWIAGQPVENVPGSLDDESALFRLVSGAGTLLHLAGVVRAADATQFERVNRQGTRRLAQALRTVAPDCRLVHVSSLAAVGPCASPEGHRPNVDPQPISDYGRSKLGAEREVAELEDYQRWTVVRPPAVYGPRDTDVLQFFKMAEVGWMAAPSGERWVSVAFVGDVVRAILAAAAEGEHGRIYHVGEERPYRFDELLRSVAESGGVRARVVYVPRGVMKAAGFLGSGLHKIGFARVPITRDKMGEILARHWTAFTADSLAALGCTNATPFFEGARLTWDWYRAHGWVG